MAAESVGTILSLGVDWITCVGSGEDSAGPLVTLGADLLRWQIKGGFKHQGWGMAGFKGFSSSGVQYGIRNHEAIVRLSGDMAHKFWRYAYALAQSTTRVDLECTSTTTVRPERRVRRAYEKAARYSRRTSKKTAVTIVHCTTGGDTCYFGKRQSLRFGRIYDKFAQSKDPRWSNAVRFEVEFKGALCAPLLSSIRDSRTPEISTARHLRRFFRDRGLDYLFADGLSTHIVVSRPASDDIRALEWLRMQCRPTVQRFIRAGKSELVMKALGLSENSLLELDGPVGPWTM